jgi:hypothetical protein
MKLFVVPVWIDCNQSSTAKIRSQLKGINYL